MKISAEQRTFLNTIFLKMIEEQDRSYPYKDELIRNYIQLIVHESVKMQPTANIDNQKNAVSRITSVFLELLERQFPIEEPHRPLQLRKAQEIAQELHIHVNSLNRSAREITGRTTTDHISERVAAEAMALLRHTDWNIAEIAYTLGFAYPTYFNQFFKSHTGFAPSAFRQSDV